MRNKRNRRHRYEDEKYGLFAPEYVQFGRRSDDDIDELSEEELGAPIRLTRISDQFRFISGPDDPGVPERDPIRRSILQSFEELESDCVDEVLPSVQFPDEPFVCLDDLSPPLERAWTEADFPQQPENDKISEMSRADKLRLFSSVRRMVLLPELPYWDRNKLLLRWFLMKFALCEHHTGRRYTDATKAALKETKEVIVDRLRKICRNEELSSAVKYSSPYGSSRDTERVATRFFHPDFDPEVGNACSEWPNWRSVGIGLVPVVPNLNHRPITVLPETDVAWSRELYFQRREKDEPTSRSSVILTHAYVVSHLPPLNLMSRTTDTRLWFPVRCVVQCLDSEGQPLGNSLALSTDNVHAQDIRPIGRDTNDVAFVRVVFWGKKSKSWSVGGDEEMEEAKDRNPVAYVRRFGFLGIRRDCELDSDGGADRKEEEILQLRDDIRTASQTRLIAHLLSPTTKADCGIRSFVAPSGVSEILSLDQDRNCYTTTTSTSTVVLGLVSRSSGGHLEEFRHAAELVLQCPFVFVLQREDFAEWKKAADIDWENGVGASSLRFLQVRRLVKERHMGLVVVIRSQHEALVKKKFDIRTFSGAFDPPNMFRNLVTLYGRVAENDVGEKMQLCEKKRRCTKVLRLDHTDLKQSIWFCPSCKVRVCVGCAKRCHRRCRVQEKEEEEGEEDEGEDISVFEMDDSPFRARCDCVQGKVRCCATDVIDPEEFVVRVEEGSNSLDEAIMYAGRADFKLRSKDLHTNKDTREWFKTQFPESEINEHDDGPFDEGILESLDEIAVGGSFDRVQEVVGCWGYVWNFGLCFVYLLLETVRMRWYMFGIITLFVALSGFESILGLGVYLAVDFFLTWVTLNRLFFLGLFRSLGYLLSCGRCCPTQDEAGETDAQRCSLSGCLGQCKIPYRSVFEFAVKYEYFAESAWTKILRLVSSLVVSVAAFVILIVAKRESDITCYTPMTLGTGLNQTVSNSSDTFGILHMFHVVYVQPDMPQSCVLESSDIVDYYKTILFGVIALVFMIIGQLLYDGPMSEKYYRHLLILEENGVDLLGTISVGLIDFLFTEPAALLENVLQGLMWMRGRAILEIGPATEIDPSLSHVDLSYFTKATAFEVGMLQYFFVDILREKEAQEIQKDVINEEAIRWNIGNRLGIVEDWPKMLLLFSVLGVALLLALVIVFIVLEMLLIASTFFWNGNALESSLFLRSGLQLRGIIYGVLFAVCTMLVIGMVGLATVFSGRVIDAIVTLVVNLTTTSAQAPFSRTYRALDPQTTGNGKRRRVLCATTCCVQFTYLYIFIVKLVTLCCSAMFCPCCTAFFVPLLFCFMCCINRNDSRRCDANDLADVLETTRMFSRVCAACCCFPCFCWCRGCTKKLARSEAPESPRRMTSSVLLHRSHRFIESFVSEVRSSECVAEVLDTISGPVLNQVYGGLSLGVRESKHKLNVSKVLKFAKMMRHNRQVMKHVARIDADAESDVVNPFAMWCSDRADLGPQLRIEKAAKKEEAYRELLQTHAFQLGQWFMMVLLVGGPIPPGLRLQEFCGDSDSSAAEETKTALLYTVSESKDGELIWSRVYRDIDGETTEIEMRPSEVVGLLKHFEEGTKFRPGLYLGKKAFVPVKLLEETETSLGEVELYEVWKKHENIQVEEEDEVVRRLKKRTQFHDALRSLDEVIVVDEEDLSD